MRVAFAVLAVVPSLASAQLVTTTPVASGLSRPVCATGAPGDDTRLFIVEQRGHAGVADRGAIRVLNLTTGQLLAAPFLQVNGVSTGSEQGLLGLTFHPDYANNGLFYVNYTDDIPGNSTVVEEYHVSGDPDIADAAPVRRILTIAQPQTNHNGGWISFGPDGLLYISAGDGGNGGDTGPGHSAQGNAQEITDNLLGTILRIDVGADDFPADANRNYAIPPTNPFVGVTGDDEIWAYGLRNPWRNAFDRLTGDLYIADVGQGEVEEIDVQPAASPGGENYGWRVMEGNNCFDDSQTDGAPPCSDPSLAEPIHTYTHADGCAVTGGEVYRGCAIPGLDGTYFFADYCSDRVWSLRYDGVSVTDFQERTAEFGGISGIAGFGLDANGEMYVCSLAGTVSRIDPAGGIVDLDVNGTPDSCEPDGCSDADVTTQGAGVGDQGYGIPDGQVTAVDINFYVNFWIAQSPLADLTTTGAGSGDPGYGVPDGSVTAADLNYFVNTWVAGCP